MTKQFKISEPSSPFRVQRKKLIIKDHFPSKLWHTTLQKGKPTLLATMLKFQNMVQILSRGEFSLIRPHWADSIIKSPHLSVRTIRSSFFRGLSLVLRAYDQFPGLSLVLPPPHAPQQTKKLDPFRIPPKNNLRKKITPSHPHKKNSLRPLTFFLKSC